MLKIGLFLLLVLLAKISQGVLVDSSSCIVPFIENGEMGKIQTRNTSSASHEEFQKVHFWEQVDSNETLFLRCKKGFLPVDDSKFLVSNRLEVTCNNGEWSKVLPCEKISCTGEPPAIKNGKAEIGSRDHGYSIWYSCKNRNFVKVAGIVRCHFGKWIGNPPKCLNYPCNTKILQEIRDYPNKQRYPGLIIPLQEYFETREGFEIHCENGFRRATYARKINCNRGSWDISQNPCIEERADETTLTAQPEKISPVSEVPHVVSVELPGKKNLYVDHNRGCFCTYDYESYYLKAQIDQKILKRGDKVMRGGTVSLECNPETRPLTWQNGFRYFGKANMTCSTCESWERKDLPTCKNVARSDTFIAFDKDFKILPGGIIDVNRGDSSKFFCTSTYDRPVWKYDGRWGVSVTPAQAPVYGNLMFMNILHINYLSDQHSGKYECCIPEDFGKCTRSSFLELQVNEITCPWFPNRIGLNISYTHENKVGSWATFSCASNAELVGFRTAGCQDDGTWSATQPYCKKIYCTVPPDPVNGRVTYSSLKYGTELRYECNVGFLVEKHQPRICSENGSWSNEEPECIEARCEEPQAPEHGSVKLHGEPKVGSLATYSCDPGKRLIGAATTKCLITGQWTFDPPQCLNREEHTTISTTPPEKTSAEECFCTYDYENPFVKAQIGHRKLKRGDNIMRGETVSFECKFVSRALLSWQNGLRFFGKTNMTCNTCKKWQSKHLPTCDYTVTADAVIGYEEELKILPGGIVDIRRGESRQFFCSSSWSQPQWDYAEKKDVSVNITQVSGQGNIVFVSLLNIMRTEKEHSGKYECYMRGDHSQRFGSSFLDLQVDEFLSCSRFPDTPVLKVTYSKNVSVGSIATFSCSSTSKSLIGSSTSACRENGSWSNPLPSCEESRCSVHDLLISVPEDVVLDMTGVNEEFISSGSVVDLKCNDSYIIDGNSKARCSEHGKWEFGSFQCVPGCILNIDPSSHLLVQPMKDSYRLGEFLILSCPPGEKMSSDVDRLMCLGGRWSDFIPDCEQ